MKKIKVHSIEILCSLLIFSFFMSCTKMDDTYKQFVVPNGINYIGKADSVLIYSGRKRVEVTWLRGTDPNTTAAVIYWNNKADSIKVPVNDSNPLDRIIAKINSLPENSYTFQIVTMDDQGNRSIIVDAQGDSYDSNYEATLLPRAINAINNNNGITNLSWYASDTTSFTTEITYLDEQLKPELAYLPMDSTSIDLPSYKEGTYIKFRSLFKPDPNSIDTFYTHFDSVKVNWNSTESLHFNVNFKVLNVDRGVR